MLTRALILSLVLLPSLASAQFAGGPPDWVRIPAYPPRATDAAKVERGKGLYVANGCSFCHGADARGGNGGPSLVRSQRVMRDREGELIAEPIVKGVPNTTMVAFPLTQQQISEIAEFLHKEQATRRVKAEITPQQFLTGNAAAGKRYFAKQCAVCHSVDRDLKGFAGKFTEPRPLQQRWLLPSGAATTAVITLPDGSRHEGMLVRQDEFLITIGQADGTQRTFARDGSTPAVEIRDPLARHRELLPQYTDRDIHNLTAYLVTLK